MGCADKEKLGKEEVFNSFESNAQEEISIDEAKAQEAKADKIRKEEA